MAGCDPQRIHGMLPRSFRLMGRDGWPGMSSWPPGSVRSFQWRSGHTTYISKAGICSVWQTERWFGRRSGRQCEVRSGKYCCGRWRPTPGPRRGEGRAPRPDFGTCCLIISAVWAGSNRPRVYSSPTTAHSIFTTATSGLIAATPSWLEGFFSSMMER
jgi:hypothetical protein